MDISILKVIKLSVKELKPVCALCKHIGFFTLKNGLFTAYPSEQSLEKYARLTMIMFQMSFLLLPLVYLPVVIAFPCNPPFAFDGIVVTYL